MHLVLHKTLKVSAGVIPGSEIAAPTNPLKPGESGTSEFIAGEEGTYYYICTVPGHRASRNGWRNYCIWF